MLRSRRAARGVSLREVASEAGIGVSYLHRLERGLVARPGADRLGRVADALDLPRASLLRAAGYL